jgi:hypothetical protein
MPQPSRTITLTQEKLDRVIRARVERERRRCVAQASRADLTDALQLALADSVARITELEGQLAHTREQLAQARPSTPSAWAHATSPRRRPDPSTARTPDARTTRALQALPHNRPRGVRPPYPRPGAWRAGPGRSTPTAASANGPRTPSAEPADTAARSAPSPPQAVRPRADSGGDRLSLSAGVGAGGARRQHRIAVLTVSAPGCAARPRRSPHGTSGRAPLAHRSGSKPLHDPGEAWRSQRHGQRTSGYADRRRIGSSQGEVVLPSAEHDAGVLGRSGSDQYERRHARQGSVVAIVFMVGFVAFLAGEALPGGISGATGFIIGVAGAIGVFALALLVAALIHARQRRMERLLLAAAIVITRRRSERAQRKSPEDERAAEAAIVAEIARVLNHLRGRPGR